jgi:hypothetical protein
MVSFLAGLFISMAGLALLYSREVSCRAAGALLAAAGVVFVFASPGTDLVASFILLALVAFVASLLFGLQWLWRPAGKGSRQNGRPDESPI